MATKPLYVKWVLNMKKCSSFKVDQKCLQKLAASLLSESPTRDINTSQLSKLHPLEIFLPRLEKNIFKLIYMHFNSKCLLSEFCRPNVCDTFSVEDFFPYGSEEFPDLPNIYSQLNTMHSIIHDHPRISVGLTVGCLSCWWSSYWSLFYRCIRH